MVRVYQPGCGNRTKPEGRGLVHGAAHIGVRGRCGEGGHREGLDLILCPFRVLVMLCMCCVYVYVSVCVCVCVCVLCELYA